MKNKRKLYIGIVIMLTIITVGIIASMRIDETNTEIYDKLDTYFGRGGGIRTPGPMVPNHVRYQTALHPAKLLPYHYMTNN